MANVKENALPFTLSVLMHVAIGVLFVLSLEFVPKSKVKPEVNVIDAVAVDESKIQREIDKLKKTEQRKKDEEDRHQRELETDAQRAKSQRQTEEQNLAELKKKKEQEKLDLTELAKKKKTETEQAAKVQKEREALEQKKKEEQAQVDKLALKRKMEEEQLKEKMRQEELQKQKAREQALQDKEIKKAVTSFEGQIRGKVEGVWVKPTNFAPGAACTVSVKLIPTGDVVSSNTSNCTGDDIFIRSVEAAIQKASPLPVPKDPVVFDRMRDIDFVFRPQ